MKSITLPLLLTLITVVGCTTTKKVQRSEQLLTHAIAYTVDTTRLRYTIEVLNEYHRDTLVRTLYKESGEERRAVTVLRDTLRLHTLDTVYIATGAAAPLGEGVIAAHKSRERRLWAWVAVVVALCATVLTLRYIPRRR